MRRPTPRRAALVALVAPFLLLAACGDDDPITAEGTSSTLPATTLAGGPANDAELLASTVEAWIDNMSGGFWEAAYDGYSQECRGKFTQQQVETFWSATLLAFAKQQDLDVETLSVSKVNTRNVADGKGEAQVVLDLDDFDDPASAFRGYSKWIYEDETWKNDACDLAQLREMLQRDES